MSDYTPITTFTTKDGLSTGDPEKIISGADVDAEFSAIQTAIATKYDSADVASEAQAQAETSNSVLITPLRLQSWSAKNSAVIDHLHAVSGLAAGGDKLFFFDDTDDTTKALTVGDGLEISTTTLQLPATLAGDGLSYVSGVLTVGGGFGISAGATTVSLNDVTAGLGNFITITNGSFSCDMSSLNDVNGNQMTATSRIYVDLLGLPYAIERQNLGFPTQTGQTTQPLTAADMNTIMEFNTTATVTLPLNSSVAIPTGTAIIIVNDNASTQVTVSAATSVTLNSINHPGGASAASDKVLAGGTAVCIKTETDEWYLSGDITD